MLPIVGKIVAMTLKDYLAKQPETIEAFAARVKASTGMIHKIVYGTRQPSLSLAAAIQQATDGKVTPLDMLLAGKPKPSRSKVVA